MKVYIQTDLEGVAGVTFFENTHDASPENQAHRRRMQSLLTGEVRAAVQGAFDAGAANVVVNDNHGSGYNIHFECLDPRCEIIHGRNCSGPHWLPALDASFDALVLVGMHAMADTRGALLSHTQWIVNDGKMLLSEAAMAAAIAGDFGVPTVFASGDDRVTAEVRGRIPMIETVIVKRALGTYLAQSRMPAAVRADIRAGVKKGLERRKIIPPFAVPGPLTLNLLESACGNEDARGGFRKCLGADIRADTINAAFCAFVARMPWFPGQISLPDGFDYPGAALQRVPPADGGTESHGADVSKATGADL